VSEVRAEQDGREDGKDPCDGVAAHLGRADEQLEDTAREQHRGADAEQLPHS
jgi:hypothetical protein